MREKKGVRKLLVMMMLLAALMSFGMSGNAMAASKKVGSTKITKVSRKFIGDQLDFRKARYKLQWKKVKGASGYQVQWREKAFYGHPYAAPERLNAKKNKTTITTSLISEIRIRVRAYKVVNGKKVYGKWSKYYHDVPAM